MVGIVATLLGFLFWYIVCKYLLKPLRVKMITRKQEGEKSFKFHVDYFFSEFLCTVPCIVGIFVSAFVYPFLRGFDGPERVYMLAGFALSSFVSGVITVFVDLYVWETG